MAQWQIDFSSLTMSKSGYRAALYKCLDGSYSIHSVIDTGDVGRRADNLGADQTMELARSARAALTAYPRGG
jgi:hypothetical protein